MMNLVKKILIFVIFLNFILGCGGPGVLIGPITTGVIYWINGEAHQYYEYPADVVYRTTKHTLQELNIPISTDNVNKDSFQIIAGEQNRFNIKVTQVDKNISKLSMRINTLGDKDFAELIYKKIDQNIAIIQFDPEGNPTGRRKVRH